MSTAMSTATTPEDPQDEASRSPSLSSDSTRNVPNVPVPEAKPQAGNVPGVAPEFLGPTGSETEIFYEYQRKNPGLDKGEYLSWFQGRFNKEIELRRRRSDQPSDLEYMVIKKRSKYRERLGQEQEELRRYSEQNPLATFKDLAIWYEGMYSKEVDVNTLKRTLSSQADGATPNPSNKRGRRTGGHTSHGAHGNNYPGTSATFAVNMNQRSTYGSPTPGTTPGHTPKYNAYGVLPPDRDYQDERRHSYGSISQHSGPSNQRGSPGHRVLDAPQKWTAVNGVHSAPFHVPSHEGNGVPQLDGGHPPRVLGSKVGSPHLAATTVPSHARKAIALHEGPQYSSHPDDHAAMVRDPRYEHAAPLGTRYFHERFVELFEFLGQLRNDTLNCATQREGLQSHDEQIQNLTAERDHWRKICEDLSEGNREMTADLEALRPALESSTIKLRDRDRQLARAQRLLQDNGIDMQGRSDSVGAGNDYKTVKDLNIWFNAMMDQKAQTEKMLLSLVEKVETSPTRELDENLAALRSFAAKRAAENRQMRDQWMSIASPVLERQPERQPGSPSPLSRIKPEPQQPGLVDKPNGHGIFERMPDSPSSRGLTPITAAGTPPTADLDKKPDEDTVMGDTENSAVAR